MKRKIFSAILVAAGLLSGCSSEEVVPEAETAGQSGTLTFSFPLSRPGVTYSIADDVTAGADVTAVGNENVINDVTVYMFQNSNEEKLVAKQSVSSEGGVQSVTIDVSNFTSGNEDYVFYAVANVHNNITDNFTIGVTTLSIFTAAVATATDAVPISGSNMLMVGYKTIAGLDTATPSTQVINLRHRVARFDIDNLAFDDNSDNDNLTSGEPGYNEKETFFTITKIHVLNTLSSGYLTKENNGQTRTPLTDKSTLTIPVDGVPNINTANLAEGAFYLWPGKLAAKADWNEGSTIIEVEGYSVDLKPRLFTVQLGSAQEILANKRYTLSVSRISQTTLAFALTASNWEDDTNVQATPESVDTFEYGEFALNGFPLESNDIDLSDKTGDSELTFYTDGDSKATGVLTATLDLTEGSAYASEVTLAPDGDPVVTYSVGKIRQYYKITLPKPSIAVSGTLVIDDGKGKTKTFDITFDPGSDPDPSTPYYSNTGLKAVLVGGKYWAPVNVGATSTTYSADVAGCGYIFQWGRSYAAFTYGSEDDTLEGPVTASEASNNYANKFIFNNITEPYDWVDPQDSDLWPGDNAQGPCPAGWRVPTSDELEILMNKYSDENFSDHRLRIPRDPEQSLGDDLYLPAAGSRDYAGTWNYQGAGGNYWSSSCPSSAAMMLEISVYGAQIYGFYRTCGGSVRCIQE
ncbi:MAG: FimB/Mfa2 family fimbrial subunit [Prevotella sp.]|nr:FimB/Mfa2 family fimbrial subunit [Prevotella sp.]